MRRQRESNDRAWARFSPKGFWMRTGAPSGRTASSAGRARVGIARSKMAPAGAPANASVKVEKTLGMPNFRASFLRLALIQIVDARDRKSRQGM